MTFHYNSPGMFLPHFAAKDLAYKNVLGRFNKLLELEIPNDFI